MDRLALKVWLIQGSLSLRHTVGVAYKEAAFTVVVVSLY